MWIITIFIPSVAQVKVGSQLELTKIAGDAVYLVSRGDGDDILWNQSDVGRGHREAIGAATCGGIHLVFGKRHRTGRYRPDLLQRAARIWLDRDNHLLTCSRFLCIDLDATSVLVVDLDFPLVYLRSEGDVPVSFSDEIVIVDCTVFDIDAVGLHGCIPRINHIIDGISLIVGSLDVDEVILHDLDRLSLFLGVVIADGHLGMLFLVGGRHVLRAVHI